jgi:hypothetical protein
VAFSGSKERELAVELKLANAKAEMANVYAGHGTWLRKTYDPKNTKLTVPADIAADAMMKDRQYYHVAMPRSETQLEAVLTVMRHFYEKGSPVIVYLFTGREEGKEE